MGVGHQRRICSRATSSGQHPRWLSSWRDACGRAAKRVLLETAGWLLLLVGLAAIPLPGPGLLVTFAGLLLLSRQYEWAERRVEMVRLRALQGAAKSAITWPRLTVSIAGLVLAVTAGIVWIASPPAPSWWPLAQSWWLPGGLVTGVTQAASAAVALVLIVYSHRRFHGQPEALAALEREMKDAHKGAHMQSSGVGRALDHDRRRSDGRDLGPAGRPFPATTESLTVMSCTCGP